MYTGQDAIITADLNRFSPAAYLAMANAALAGGATVGAGAAVPNGGAGADLNGATGTLLLTENQMFALIVVFPYAPKAVYQNAANGGPLMPCYVFPATTLEGPDDLDIGMQPFKVHAVWHAIRAFQPGGTPFGTGNFQLYYFASVSSLSLPAAT